MLEHELRWGIRNRSYGDCNAKQLRPYNPTFQFVDLPYEYYDRILQQIRKEGGTWRQIWMCSRCGMQDANGVAKLLVQNYGAHLAPQSTEPHSELGEFVFMLKASRFIMAQSTFSWWCAFLGKASQVYFPLVGDWWGGRKARFRLYVDEPRYVGDLALFNTFWQTLAAAGRGAPPSPPPHIYTPLTYFLGSLFNLRSLAPQIYNDLLNETYFLNYDTIKAAIAAQPP